MVRAISALRLDDGEKESTPAKESLFTFAQYLAHKYDAIGTGLHVVDFPIYEKDIRACLALKVNGK